VDVTQEDFKEEMKKETELGTEGKVAQGDGK